jgi:hypothetical protein
LSGEPPKRLAFSPLPAGEIHAAASRGSGTQEQYAYVYIMTPAMQYVNQIKKSKKLHFRILIVTMVSGSEFRPEWRQRSFP